MCVCVCIVCVFCTDAVQSDAIHAAPDPPSRSPVIAAAYPTFPTTANILLNPPATGGPVSSYEVKLCPNPPASGACITAATPTVSCPVTGLTPSATYIVSAVALVGGKRVPASNTLPLTMPGPDAPTLISAMDTSSTTGVATAAPPPGVSYIQVRGTHIWHRQPHVGCQFSRGSAAKVHGDCP